MKILYVSLDPRQPFHARTGGATHMREMIRALKEEGQQVETLAPQSGFSQGRGLKPRVFTKTIKAVVPGRLWLLARDLNDIRLDRKEESRIKDAVKTFSPNVIYERNAYLFASGARVAAEIGVPYFLEINAPTAIERRENFGAPLAAWHQRIESFQHRVAGGIVVVSEPLKRYLVEAGVERKKIRVVPNGVRLDRFEGCREKGRDLREKLGLDGPIIGFVGSFASHHGLNRLFEAMPKVREAFPAAAALVVGGGPLLNSVQGLASGLGHGAVKFVGEVDPEDVPGYISVFDVGVLPRTAEYCSPIKLFEYGAVGVPVIAPRTAPVSEIMGAKGNGIVIDEGDSMADAIIKLLSKPDKAKAMGESFRKLVIEQYTWRHAARRVIAFIEEQLK